MTSHSEVMSVLMLHNIYNITIPHRMYGNIKLQKKNISNFNIATESILLVNIHYQLLLHSHPLQPINVIDVVNNLSCSHTPGNKVGKLILITIYN